MIPIRHWRRWLAGATVLAGLGQPHLRASDDSADAIAAGFRHPPSSVRTRLFWRVFGPAWTPAEIDYQLDLLKEAGVGGVMTFFMYPVAVDSASVHNQHFLSGEFLEVLGYAARQAQAKELRFSVAGGTGWPFGGPSVDPTDAAQRLRQVALPVSASGWVTVPKLGGEEKVFAVFRGWENVTGRLDPLTEMLPVGNGATQVLAYITGPTRMRVKRPALGGEGWVVDHYQSGAAGRYLDAVVAPMLQAAPGKIESVFCDSLEVYGANWTADLPEEFQHRRGYPFASALEDLFQGQTRRAAGIRFDFWRTLAELTEERFTRFVADWAHQQGIKLELEAYGTPPNPLTAAAYIDVPTGEQYEWKGFSLSRLAASGAHLTGRRIIGAEAWTWLGLPNRLGDSLSDLKLASDLHFLAGVNDLTGVDFAYSPRSVPAPGWLPYYGPVLNQNNPQWPWFRHLMDYTSRCQWLLRQGRPVAQIAVYLPVEDKFAAGRVDQMLLGFELRDNFVSGEKTDEFGLQTALRHESDLLHTLLANGFNYDGIDFFTLDRLAQVKGDHLVAGDGDYSVLVLPSLVGVEVDAWRKVGEFCRKGGTVIAVGRLPDRVYGGPPGPGSKEPSSSEFEELFGVQPDLTHAWERACGRGRVVFVPEAKTGLAAALGKTRPDVRFESPQPDIGFVHRQTASEDIYFLANTAEQPHRFHADFATTHGNVALWNPLDGSQLAFPRTVNRDDSVGVRVDLPPRGSVFLVFGNSNFPLPPLPQAAVFQSEGLSPVWHLAFHGPRAPASRALTNLTSWTTWPEARFFSGSATYTAEFLWRRGPSRSAFLTLGEVREVAEVTINGHLAGAAWTGPREVEIAPWLRPGTNSLSITVANLPLNLFLGTPDEDLGPLRKAYGDRFPAPEEKQSVREPAPSGLLGPVRIRFTPE